MIRKINKSDKNIYLDLAREFYSSPAVCHNVPESHFLKTFEEALRSDEYIGLFMLAIDGEICGYGMTARTFSQEAGGIVVWLEELYIRPEFRSRGLGKEFFDYVRREQPAARYRLEVEADNTRAKSLYERLGYKILPYEQMYKE